MARLAAPVQGLVMCHGTDGRLLRSIVLLILLRICGFHPSNCVSSRREQSTTTLSLSRCISKYKLLTSLIANRQHCTKRGLRPFANLFRRIAYLVAPSEDRRESFIIRSFEKKMKCV